MSTRRRLIGMNVMWLCPVFPFLHGHMHCISWCLMVLEAAVDLGGHGTWS